MPASRKGIEAIWANNEPNTSIVEIDGAGKMRRASQMRAGFQRGQKSERLLNLRKFRRRRKASERRARTAWASADRSVD